MSQEVFRIAVVAPEVPSVNIVHEAVPVIVDTVSGHFVWIRPDVVRQVEVIVVHAAIDHGDDDVSARVRVPCFRAVDLVDTPQVPVRVRRVVGGGIEQLDQVIGFRPREKGCLGIVCGHEAFQVSGAGGGDLHEIHVRGVHLPANSRSLHDVEAAKIVLSDAVPQGHHEMVCDHSGVGDHRPRPGDGVRCEGFHHAHEGISPGTPQKRGPSRPGGVFEIVLGFTQDFRIVKPVRPSAFRRREDNGARRGGGLRVV